MPGDAPEIPAATDKPEEVAPSPLEPEYVDSLTAIVQAVQESPPKPDDIELEWYLPPSTKHPRGRVQRLKIETKYPDDAFMLGIKYQTEFKQKIRETKVDEKGATIPAHPLYDVAGLAREVVVRPTWLHNEAVLVKLKETLPAPTFAELRRKLMLTAGLDGDFFADYQQLTVPRTLLLSALDSLNASVNPPGPSTGTEPKNSSPGPTSTGAAEPKPAESASPTTSGSSPSIPTTAPPA